MRYRQEGLERLCSCDFQISLLPKESQVADLPCFCSGREPSLEANKEPLGSVQRCGLKYRVARCLPIWIHWKPGHDL
jgi:hypothetical protein